MKGAAVSVTTDPRLDQRLVALQRANVIRSRIAGLKREIRDGETSVPDVLLDMPDWVRSMKVYDLLVAQRRWGSWRALAVLKLVPVSPPRRLGDLTDRECGELARRVRLEQQSIGRPRR